VDGCILFSDILTPLPGMGVEFDIDEKIGPKLKPMRSIESISTMFVNKDWSKSTPFVKQSLGEIRRTVGNSATVLGFVGLPFTLATYLVEGGTSNEYMEIKKLIYAQPQTLHKMLEVLLAISHCLDAVNKENAPDSCCQHWKLCDISDRFWRTGDSSV